MLELKETEIPEVNPNPVCDVLNGPRRGEMPIYLAGFRYKVCCALMALFFIYAYFAWR